MTHSGAFSSLFLTSCVANIRPSYRTRPRAKTNHANAGRSRAQFARGSIALARRAAQPDFRTALACVKIPDRGIWLAYDEGAIETPTEIQQ